jgi:hypothetical protein
MSKKIKLMPDYECSPIWDVEKGGEIMPGELPLSDELIERLRKWAEKYDQTLDREDPKSSGFASREEEEKFETEGRELWEGVTRELGNDYEVLYYSQTKSELMDQNSSHFGRERRRGGDTT